MPDTDTDRSVDEMDLNIIRELEIDALASNAEIGVKVSASPTTVRRRIQRLLDRRIVAVTTIPDPFAFGYEIQSTIVINTSGGRVSEVAEALAALPSIQYVVITTGRYDIFAMAVFRDSDDMFHFVTHGLGSIPNLMRAEIMTSMKIAAKSSWSLLTSQPSRIRSPQAPYAPDALQRRILGELENNPRQSHTELSRKLGIARHTVRRKIRALLDDGVIQIVAIPDPRVLGYRTRAGILVKVEPRYLQSVADELIANERIQHVIISTGRYDIMAWAVFRDSEELADFTRGKLGSIPGIVSHETVINLRVVKGGFRLIGSQ